MDLSGLSIQFPQLIVLAFAVCAGLCLRQSGLVRRPYAASADLQCLAVFVAGCAAFWSVGFGLMTSAGEAGAVVPGLLGKFGFLNWPAGAARSFFLDMAIAAIVGQAIAGALAERMRFVPLVIFALLVTGAIFPIVASWRWGGGWLAERGFVDFGGATLVHSVAGWAALAGTMVLGGRRGRFDSNYELDDTAHHSLLLAFLGTLLVLAGWQGVMAGLARMVPVGLPVPSLAPLLANINIAAFAGGAVALGAGFMLDRARLVPIALNGILAGLVAISADPLHATILSSLLVGAVAGVLAASIQKLIEILRLDDVTDAITAHLAAGIWGTLAAAFTAPHASLGVQALGIVSVGAFVFAVSFALFFVLQILFGLRANPLEPRMRSADA